jgi:hypothetical protein
VALLCLIQLRKSEMDLCGFRANQPLSGLAKTWCSKQGFVSYFHRQDGFPAGIVAQRVDWQQFAPAAIRTGMATPELHYRTTAPNQTPYFRNNQFS